MSTIVFDKRENMKYSQFGFFSVFVALGMLPLGGDAAIRVGNAARNNAQAYQQVNAMRYQGTSGTQQTEEQELNLPINVPNQELAQKIYNGDESAGATIEDLERCSMIYPNGEFEWTKPTIGMMAGTSETCTSVVELRVMIPKDGKEYTTLARANLAAGDTFDCNVSNFPEWALLDDAGTVEFPADAQPEVADVIAVMNEEQKQNAAIKIISGAVLGGLGGNIAGKNEVGKDGVFGGGKDKITSTVIGAVGGAGLMAASSYSGKVAGDMILSTGVNAAAGAVVGNMVTGGDGVLRIEPCVVDEQEYSCLWGYVEKESDTAADDKTMFVSVSDIHNFRVCDKGYKNCSMGMVGGGKVKGYDNHQGAHTIEDVYSISGWVEKSGVQKYCLDGNIMKKSDNFEDCSSENKKSHQYVEIVDGKLIEKRVPAMIVDVEDKAFGYKQKDWENGLKKELMSANKRVVGREGNGKATDLATEYANIEKFLPMYLETEDGGIIDLNNKARLKGTLTGAGIGGAAGAFTAYQGAQTEIDERWVAAVREYKDSLQKFYCGTGKRFLSFYNDLTVIPHQN